MPPTPSPHAGLSRLSEQLLPVLYQHRLVATSQLHTLLTPTTRSTVYLRRALARLRALGLADHTTRRTSRTGRAEHLHFLTSDGCELVEQGREVTARAYRINPTTAASQLQEHTLAVVESGATFTAWARRLGDECGPLDWEPELAHRVRDGENRLGDDAVLIPDAVLRYTRTTEDGRRQLLSFFLEIDRATMHVTRLGQKLTAYARYATYLPQPVPGRRPSSGTLAGREAWRDRYPALPRLLFIFTGASEAALTRRTEDLRAVADADTRLRHSPLLAGATTLAQLRDAGPFAPIVTPLLGDPAPTDVLLTAVHPAPAGSA